MERKLGMAAGFKDWFYSTERIKTIFDLYDVAKVRKNCLVEGKTLIRHIEDGQPEEVLIDIINEAIAMYENKPKPPEMSIHEARRSARRFSKLG